MKTLKDIEKKIPERNGDYSLVNGEELRELAREWIREMNCHTGIEHWASKEAQFNVMCTEHNDIAVEWIKHFFNLSEDE